VDIVGFLRILGISGNLTEGVVPVALIFLLAVTSTWLFMPRIREYAIEVGTADMPNERRLNKEPLPNIGGLTILGGVLCAMVLAIALKGAILASVQVQVLAIILGGTILALVGFIDDQFSLPPLFRLLVQMMAAGLLVVNGIHIDIAWLPDPLNIALTIFWVVGITNAVNLMDGIDGLVGGLGFIAAAILLSISAHYASRGAAVLILAALAGGCLGFLRHNFNPSRIILGDAGAYFIGYTLSAVAILGAAKTATLASVVAPLFFLAIPIIDTTQVVIRRLLRGTSITTPGKDHLHHLLLKSGLSQRRTVLVLWGIILTLNIIGMIIQGIPIMAVIVTALVIVALLASVVLQRVQETKNIQSTPTQSVQSE
jgi:UDP-GlcNAc:undecaprenyl-phosphate/decaprenyl-phosphate GlcNAc-1-phosphate transferase